MCPVLLGGMHDRLAVNSLKGAIIWFSRFLADKKLKRSESGTHICMTSHIFV